MLQTPAHRCGRACWCAGVLVYGMRGWAKVGVATGLRPCDVTARVVP